MKDIETIDDIKRLVDTFYQTVQKDELIGPVFNTVVQDRWPEHLEKMYRFWQSILLNEPSYSGKPFPPHQKLDIYQKHFDHWVNLFENTVSQLFVGKNANEAIKRAKLMGALFGAKHAHLREK
ncbi:MAG: group III truncated hemoglobin [Crocinitomicaceae bacterium]|nr:group III truncated hemoglobin [Crocinitomicaceae bacterium]MBT5402029.1 group III truncated hemoglobin [Crocinitomicaceae bacterium]MBT6029425.1 group III truncated hemoglobin [Crocinitomicaceae bacterium]MBT6515012.1 group III truncated hemoglobin [Crocinitomicaceae bacterium]MDG2332310.1 group III truncated hemoglobin [Flavobacteriales bacterium]